MERKEHYRMYKHGKQWMFGIVTAASVMLLGAKAEVSVHADTNQASDKTASTTANNNLTQAKQVALQSTTTNTAVVKIQATNSTSTAKVTATHVAAAKSTNQSTNNAASQASTSTKTSDSTTKTTNDNTQASSDGTNTSSSTNTNSTNNTTPVQVHENGQTYLRQPGSDQNIIGWQSQTVNGQNEV